MSQQNPNNNDPNRVQPKLQPGVQVKPTNQPIGQGRNAGAGAPSRPATRQSTTSTSRAAYLRSRAAARDVRRGVASQAASTTTRGQELAEITGKKFREARNQYPLGVGLGFVAIGMLAGLLIPRTKQEDEWMGEQSDSIKDTVRATATTAAGEVTSHGQQAFADVTDHASSDAHRRGLDREGITGKLSSVWHDALDAVLSAAEREGLTPQQLKDNAMAIASRSAEDVKRHADEAKGEITSTLDSGRRSLEATADEMSDAVGSKVDEAKDAAAKKANQAERKINEVTGTAANVKDAAMAAKSEVTGESSKKTGSSSNVDAVVVKKSNENINVTSDEDLKVKVVDGNRK